MLKGYYQIPLTQRAKEISAFVTSDGLYSYTVTPFGMKNSAATFQRMINHLIRDLEDCEGYIDDIIVYSDDWPTHIQRLQALFDRMLEANLTINLMTSDFGQATYLGYIVGQGQGNRSLRRLTQLMNSQYRPKKRTHEIFRYGRILSKILSQFFKRGCLSYQFNKSKSKICLD